jgi:hypothetical protein
MTEYFNEFGWDTVNTLQEENIGNSLKLERNTCVFIRNIL